MMIGKSCGVWLWYLLMITYFIEITDGNEGIVEPCGSHLISPRGVIQTPNFPGPFSVPIKCRWVIDASDIPFTNNSIVVYLTQLYVYEGLTFTEYAYYESEITNYGATVIKKITERNVFEYQWFKTSRPFLVIEFELDRLEGNHVRVLHDLLNVYGFNITYEMTETDVNPDSCTVRDCSFLGNCILDANYNTFICECFDEFRGPKCSNGPLCMDDNRNSVCRNGGTCGHVGAEAVRCQCPPSFTGNNCEIPIFNEVAKECAGDTCIMQCPYLGKDRRPCDCKEPSLIHNNRARYECRIKLSNATSYRTGALLQSNSIESSLRKQLAKYLRNSEITTMEDLKILSVTPSAEVTFHFFGTSNEGDKIRDTLNRLVQRRRLGEFSLESTHFTFQQKPSLRLQALRVNHVNEHEVRLDDQFILSCVAQGSVGISFVWYKDNMLVNMSKATREIWYRDLPNDGSDMHTSLLTIDRATLLDAGQYTCQVIDWGAQQCKSIYIDIKDEPDVKIVPLGATIEKGNDIQLMCITPNMRNLGIGFGWTKNRALLKLEPGYQVWEDLYPAGSILKIMNAQKSAIYTCNVAHRSMSVRVDVVNKTLIPLCPKENYWNMRWPETGPGSQVFLECPRKFIGKQVSRLCSMNDATTPAWQLPDFYDCLYQPLILPYKKFQSLTMGYQNTTGADTIIALWEILRSRKIPLYPGEGDRILNILAEIEHYQYTIHELDELYNSAETLTRIIDRILGDEYSVLRERHLLLLQQLTQRNLEYWARQLVYPYKHLALSSVVVDIRALHATGDGSNNFILQIPADDYMYAYWYTDKVTIRLVRTDNDVNDNTTASGTIIVYKNITRFSPSTYVKELEDGTDLEYRFNSRIITVAVVPLNEAVHSKIQIELKLRHVQNYSRLWNVSCGVQDLTGSWDLDSCIATLLPDEASTQCICSHPGTFAAFLTARAVRVALAEDKCSTSIVLMGCGICFIQCMVTSTVLAVVVWRSRSWSDYLKLQFSAGIHNAMLIFMYALYRPIPESCYALVAISIEAFLLLAMSAPISQALLIYAELIQHRPSPHFQLTVIAVITGLPILCVLATELTHKSTGWRHESWWLIFGSGVYNIFLSCVATMLLIFIILFTGVLRKAHALVQENIVKKEVIEQRLCMMHRAARLICGLILTVASSIYYINSTSMIHHYAFSTLSVLLGVAVLFTSLGTKEILLVTPILRKFDWNNVDGESTSNPIEVYSKKPGELGNDSTPSSGQLLGGPPYMEKRGIAAGSPDMRDYINESSVSYSKSPIARSFARYPPEIRIDHSDINLENYNTSPRKYQESMTTTFVRSPNCPTEFFPALHSTHNRDQMKFNDREIQPQFGSQAILPECSAKVLCNADIEARMSINAMPDVTLATKTEIEHCRSADGINRDHADVIPDIATTGERKQPDGEEKNPEITITDCEDTTTGTTVGTTTTIATNATNATTTTAAATTATTTTTTTTAATTTSTTTTTTGMLDRISHDLDYLLNRTQTNEEA